MMTLPLDLPYVAAYEQTMCRAYAFYRTVIQSARRELVFSPNRMPGKAIQRVPPLSAEAVAPVEAPKAPALATADSSAQVAQLNAENDAQARALADMAEIEFQQRQKIAELEKIIAAQNKVNRDLQAANSRLHNERDLMKASLADYLSEIECLKTDRDAWQLRAEQRARSAPPMSGETGTTIQADHAKPQQDHSVEPIRAVQAVE